MRAILFACLPLAACADRAAEAPLSRSGVLGSLRDLVLFDRGEDLGGPFFLDLFEATRGDYAEFAASAAGARIGAERPDLTRAGAAGLPVAGIDLVQARAFAHWRRCRVQRSDEWGHACRTDNNDNFPWGLAFVAERANTRSLGIGEAVLVGSFESGRRGTGPYDLIGNVAEWTETVPWDLFHSQLDTVSPMMRALARVAATPALWPWLLPGSVPPSFVLVAAAGNDAPREVVGGSYASSVGVAGGSVDGCLDVRHPMDRSDTIGVRFAATPGELLESLARDPGELTPLDREQLRRFVRRRNHAAVMRAALAAASLTPSEREFWRDYLP